MKLLSLFQKKRRVKTRSQGVFTFSQPHSKIRKIRLFLEIFIVVVVVMGTAATFFSWRGVSAVSLYNGFKSIVGLKRVDEQKDTQLSFEEKIKEKVDKKILNTTVIESSSDKSFYTIKSKENVVVIVSSKKDLDFQARTLQTILSKAKIEDKKVGLVDFRFEKLIVRYR